jgi:hypothetical protein
MLISTSRARRAPLLGALAFLTAACGNMGETPASAQIARLPDDEALALCQEFVAKACAAGVYDPGAPECAACRPCDQPGSLASIHAHCGAAITVGDVRRCIDSGFDQATCTEPHRGGCLFDVGDELCD